MVLCAQKHAVAGRGFPPVQPACNADGRLCSVLDVVLIISDYSLCVHIEQCVVRIK
jgi:hypothetical protein